MGKKKKETHPTKYRILIIQENEYSSWRNTLGPWEDITHPELDKKYRFWESQKIITNRKNINGNSIFPKNGSKLENNSKVTEVALQLGQFNEKQKKYVWTNRDYIHSKREIPYSMR